MHTLQINIFDMNTFAWLGQIDSVEYLQLRSSFSGIENSELKVSKKAQNVNELKIGRLLVFNGDRSKACVIQEIETSLIENAWIYTLIPLKAILNYRVVANYNHSWTQIRKGRVMAELVAYQVISGFTAGANPNRMFPNLTREILDVGDLIDYKEDWQPLGDTLSLLATIGAGYPLGWNIKINDAYNGYVYYQSEGTNRSRNQTINNPVIFSEEFGNLLNATFIESEKDYKNFAYVGEGVLQVWNGTDNNLTGFARREVVLSSSQAGTTNPTEAQIRAEGQAELKLRPRINSFTGEILNNPNTMSTYGIDWFLGDIVTIQSEKIIQDQLITVDAQITEIEEIYSDAEYTINATFGIPRLSFVQLVKNAIKK